MGMNVCTCDLLLTPAEVEMIFPALWRAGYSRKDIGSSCKIKEEQTYISLHGSPLSSLCSVYTAIYTLALSLLKMSSGKRFTVNDVLEQLFDSESDIEEHVSETEDCVEEEADFEAFSSYENESVDPPVVIQPPADMIPSKNGRIV